jgi:hypothetical protein
LNHLAVLDLLSLAVFFDHVTRLGRLVGGGSNVFAPVDDGVAAVFEGCFGCIVDDVPNAANVFFNHGQVSEALLNIGGRIGNSSDQVLIVAACNAEKLVHQLVSDPVGAAVANKPPDFQSELKIM